MICKINFGATIVHKLILQQMVDQGVEVKESYALDVGGGAESLNTIYRTRHVKRDIKASQWLLLWKLMLQ